MADHGDNDGEHWWFVATMKWVSGGLKHGDMGADMETRRTIDGGIFQAMFEATGEYWELSREEWGYNGDQWGSMGINGDHGEAERCNGYMEVSWVMGVPMGPQIIHL